MSERFEQITASTMERVTKRVTTFAAEWKLNNPCTIELKSESDGDVLRFCLVDDAGVMATPEVMEAFLNVLCLTDDVITKENSSVVYLSESDGYIEITPRNDLK